MKIIKHIVEGPPIAAAPPDITQLWSLRRAGKLPNLNRRQTAILNLWEALVCRE